MTKSIHSLILAGTMMCSGVFAAMMTTDFESGDLSAWSASPNNGYWQLATDESNGANTVLEYATTTYNEGGGYIGYASDSYGDVTLTLDYRKRNNFAAYNRFWMRADEPTTPGFGNYPQNGYYFQPDSGDLFKVVGGTATALTSNPTLNLADGAWNTFKMETIGDQISFSIWNSGTGTWNLVASATDSTFSSGYMGFSSVGLGPNGTVYYDNITIPEPSGLALMLCGLSLSLRKRGCNA